MGGGGGVVVGVVVRCVIPGFAQGLLLNLHLGITPDGALGTIQDAGDLTLAACVQDKHPTCYNIAPAPQMKSFKITDVLEFIIGPIISSNKTVQSYSKNQHRITYFWRARVKILLPSHLFNTGGLDIHSKHYLIIILGWRDGTGIKVLAYTQLSQGDSQYHTQVLRACPGVTPLQLGIAPEHS